jgi:hypothetical protein
MPRVQDSTLLHESGAGKSTEWAIGRAESGSFCPRACAKRRIGRKTGLRHLAATPQNLLRECDNTNSFHLIKNPRSDNIQDRY